MTIGLTIDERARAVASIRANVRNQAKPWLHVLLCGPDALALLDYIDELERSRDGWRSVAGVRQERRANRSQLRSRNQRRMNPNRNHRRCRTWWTSGRRHCIAA